VCSPFIDTVCNACNGCLADGKHTTSPCSETQDAVWSDCVECDPATEFEHSECEDGENRVCLPFETSAAMCAVGQYRGGHTAVRDSQCLQCAYRDRKFEGHTLHVPASRGQRYNDAHSCNVSCLGNSRIVNASNQSLGCVSCETGNVLLKMFDPEDGLADSCNFACRAGYTRVAMPDGSEDCYDPVLHSSAVNEFAHNFSVTDFSRTRNASVFRLLHQDVGFFMFVVGRGLPANCRASCCYADWWRVSSLHMMGLETWPASVTCRPRDSLPYVADGNVLSVFVPDSVLEDVAVCEWVGASRDCQLTVSLIDMHSHRATSRALRVRTTHSTSYMFSSNELRYIPLEHFEVDLVLAHRLPDGGRIFQLHTRARGAALHMHTRIPNMQPFALAALPACDRVLFGSSTLVADSGTLAVVAGQQLSAVSYWLAGADVQVVKALYTLVADDDAGQVMDIGAVRNVSALRAQCTPPVVNLTFQTAVVRVALGMGSGTVHRMTVVAPGEPTRGELGTLTTFVVQSTRAISVAISFGTVLAAYGNSADTIAAMGAQWGGAMTLRSEDAYLTRDFRPAFKAWCLQRPSECQYEYIYSGTRHANMHMLASCSTAARRAAVEWLLASFGAAHDGGHVDALCDTMAENAAYSSSVGLVHTMKFLNRRNRGWNMYQNFSARNTVTFMWPEFSIVGEEL